MCEALRMIVLPASYIILLSSHHPPPVDLSRGFRDGILVGS